MRPCQPSVSSFLPGPPILEPLEGRLLLSAGPPLQAPADTASAAPLESPAPGGPDVLDINALVGADAAHVTASPYDIGSTWNIFDGDTGTLYRSAAVNPAWVQVAFAVPKVLHEFRVWCSHQPGDPGYRWKVEAADTQADLDQQTGSYSQPVDWTETPENTFSTVALDEPVTAGLIRLSVERLLGDDYVHLNEWVVVGEVMVDALVVSPASHTMEQFGRRQYEATLIDSDGIGTDVTVLADWSSTDPSVATVGADGLVTAAGPGECEIAATYEGFAATGSLEVLPYVFEAVDLNAAFIERTPRYDYDAAKNRPGPGDTVTFHAHVVNWGDLTPRAEYRWELDGVTVAIGELSDLLPGERRTVDFEWTWQNGGHELRFVIDPDDRIDESSESNNVVELRTDALGVGFWVEQSVYDYFHEHQRELGIGSNSWEDWAQRQMARWNWYCQTAVYPDAPGGVLDRVWIDKITVVPDGALPLSWGLPSNHPDTRDKTVDLMWGFPATLLDGGMYADHASLSEGNAFYLENSLIHEMGHARYLIDNYGYDVHNTQEHHQVQITEGGEPVGGSDLMPFIAWDSVLHYNQFGGTMTGPWRAWSPYEAAALNAIAGLRASAGNYNAPGNIGVFLNDLPAGNHVRFVDASGLPLVGADVRVYRAVGGPGWYGKTIDDTWDLEFTTDADGYAHMPRNPFSDGPIQHTYGVANGIAVLRIAHGDDLWYRFMEAPAFQMEYWRGHIEDAYYTYILPEPGAGPEIDVRGYGQSIAHGDATPGLADHTDFGTADVAGTTVTRQFVVRNLGGSMLQLTGSRVEITGPHAGDFDLLNTPHDRIPPAAIATFQVRFTPTASGPRTATITITSNDPDEAAYQFVVQGTGVLDAVPPAVLDWARNDGEDRPGRLDSLAFTFSENVAPEIYRNDLGLIRLDTGESVDLTAAAFAYDPHGAQATWDLSGISMPPGHYLATLRAEGIRDAAGNELDGDGDGIGGGDFERELMVAIPADTDLNAVVDCFDYLALKRNCGTIGGATWADGDTDGDGDVDRDDFLGLRANFGRSLPPAAAPLATAGTDGETSEEEAPAAPSDASAEQRGLLPAHATFDSPPADRFEPEAESALASTVPSAWIRPTDGLVAYGAEGPAVGPDAGTSARPVAPTRLDDPADRTTDGAPGTACLDVLSLAGLVPMTL